MRLIPILAAIGAMPIVSASAGPAVFVLDAPQSALAISGTVGGAPLQQQGPGSLTTTYAGNFLINLTPQSVQFMTGGAADANTNGNWDPLPNATAGTAPADYGAQFSQGFFGTARLAVRNLIADAQSDAIALNANLTFPAASANVLITAGDVAIRSVLTSGTETLAGSSGANSGAGNATLTISRSVPAGTATAVAQIPVSAGVVTEIALIGTATINFNGSFRGSVTTILGDANFDKAVNLDDFTTLAANFGQSGSYLAGDFSGGGSVTLDDFTALAANFGLTAPAGVPRGVVPEPGAIGVACTIALLVRRRRGDAR